MERLPRFHDAFIISGPLGAPASSPSPVLLLSSAEGWALPTWVHDARYGRTARELDDPFWPAAIQEELRRRLGVEAIVLHADLHDVRDPHTGDRYTVFVLEHCSPCSTPPAGARWVSRDELATLPEVDAAHRSALEAWYA